MKHFYNLALECYYFAIRISSLFNNKARSFLKGRVNQDRKFAQLSPANKKAIWFHASSVGEFEQCKPIIDQLLTTKPLQRIVVTFYSPSAFNLYSRKDNAFEIYYLPLDRPKRIQNFIEMVRPSLVLIAKYEFWYHFLRELRLQQIPVIFFSVRFRKDMWIFKNPFRFLLDEIKVSSQIFVQTQESFDIATQNGFDNLTIGGDTRFDRVLSLAESRFTEKTAIIQALGSRIDIVAGSTWPKDDLTILPTIKKLRLKAVIVPHEMSESQLRNIQKFFGERAVRFSELEHSGQKAQVLIIDTIGILSKIYRLGQIVYVGGGFTTGIHNILEPTVYGIPVIFGPRYSKFQEAKDLIEIGCAKSVSSEAEFAAAVRHFSDADNQSTVEVNLESYFAKKSGASLKVIDYIKDNNLL